MNKQWQFTPELGLFIFFISVIAFLLVGVFFYLLIRYLGGMNITSWWRSPRRNVDVGGVSNSLHMVGLAWDVTPVTQENADKLRSYGLRVIDEGDHLHAQVI